MAKAQLVDFKHVDRLLSADLDSLVAGTQRAPAVLEALLGKVDAALAQVRHGHDTWQADLEVIQKQVTEALDVVRRLDKIVAQADVEGREDLGAKARKRKASQEEAAATLQASVVQLREDAARLGPTAEALEERRAEIRERIEALAAAPLSEPDLQLPGVADAEPDDLEGPEPIDADLLELAAAQCDGAHAIAAGDQGPPSSVPAAAPAQPEKGQDEWEKELAALMASEGVSPTPDSIISDDDDRDVDAILAGLPALVEVGPDELPEGETLPPEPKVPAVRPPPARVPAKAAPTKIAAKPEGKPPAKKKDEAPKKKRRLWPWIVALLALGGGGFGVFMWLGAGV